MADETHQDHGDDMLNDLFAQARAERPALPDALAARILADAAAVQPVVGGHAAPAPAPRPGLFRRLVAGLGGWPAVGGLVAAGAAGVWLGFAPPAFLPDPVAAVIEQQAELDLFGSQNTVLAALEE